MKYLREYYLEYNMAPMIRKLCKQTGFKLKEIYDLFPSGPAVTLLVGRTPAAWGVRSVGGSVGCIDESW